MQFFILLAKGALFIPIPSSDYYSTKLAPRDYEFSLLAQPPSSVSLLRLAYNETSRGKGGGRKGREREREKAKSGCAKRGGEQQSAFYNLPVVE